VLACKYTIHEYAQSCVKGDVRILALKPRPPFVCLRARVLALAAVFRLGVEVMLKFRFIPADSSLHAQGLTRSCHWVW
jgi:hypothetical protein